MFSEKRCVLCEGQMLQPLHFITFHLPQIFHFVSKTVRKPDISMLQDQCMTARQQSCFFQPKENIVLLNHFPESLGNYEYLILPDLSLLSAIVFFVESSTDQTHCLHFTYFLLVMFCLCGKFSMPPSCKRNVLWHDLVSLVAIALSSAGLDWRAPPLSV